MNSYYDDEGWPLACATCAGSTIVERVLVWSDMPNLSIPCEREFTCGSCSGIVAYWAYGSFDPCFARDLERRSKAVLTISADEWEATKLALDEQASCVPVHEDSDDIDF
jgi:hypothetical protein